MREWIARNKQITIQSQLQDN